jgi:hypothetical protein
MLLVVSYRWERDMARLDSEAVDKLIDLLTLPVGGDDDPRPAHSADAIRSVSEELGSLVFEDANWYRNYRPHDIEAVLEGWFDDVTAGELASKAVGPESQAWQEFLAWCGRLVSGWREGEAGVARDDGALLGIANPHYGTDQVPGTQFYRYVDDEYRYAATPDAAEWLTLEERYAAVRGAPPPGGTVIGYRNATSVLPGTAFYRQLDDGSYVYAPTEHAEAAAWHPYEYWSDQAAEAATERELLDAMKEFVAKLEKVLGS